MTILTTGVQGGNLVARQEIRVIMQDQELFTLFVLATDRLQRVDQKDLLSWFQIAGIHGRPYVAYDSSAGVNNFGGYCTHSSILFPPWHRPYLALYEQALAKHVRDIANEYQGADKDKYQQAAQRFRVPYWDWAANSDVPDVISKQKTITLNTPQGSKTMDNPLYTYTFRPMYSDFGDGLPLADERQWESWANTKRWPTNRTAQAVSQDDAMDSNLGNNRLTLRDRTYNLLTQSRTYEAFSNDGFLGPQTDPAFFDSLESIHGQIHGLTGRNGHMGVVDFAAFDPIFWMHHCNCDRIFALWQALNPSSYVVPRANPAGTFATRRGTVESVDSPLAPFWRAPGQYWTSAGVRDTRTLNYTYPELAKWATLDAGQKSTRLRTDINAMYGKSAPWASINAGLFTVTPSVPTVGRTSTAAQGTHTTGGTAGAPRIPLSNAPAAKVAEAPASKPAEAGGSKPAQQPVAAPAAPAAGPKGFDAATIRANMEAGARAAQAQAAAASRKVAEVTPAPVASAATATAKVAVAGAQKVAAAAPPAVVAATQRVAAVVPASLSAAAPAQPAAAAGKGRESFEIVADKQQGDDKTHYNEWIANITVEKYAAKTSFFVYIFLGDFNQTPSQWGTDPNLVGTHVVFANNLSFTGCERCRDAAEEHKLVTGTIPLTGALMDRLGKDKVTHLEPAEIIPYLQKELHWRIQNQEDQVIERADMPSLKVSVAHASVAIPDTITEFPTWGSAVKEAAVTTGRPGGATENDA